MSNGRVGYNLAESCIVVAGSVIYETDAQSVPANQTPAEAINRDKSAATVAVGVRGDLMAERTVELGDGGGDSTYSASQLPDGRLTALGFNSVGVGARLVSATATVVAFVGGLAASIAGAGTSKLPGRAAVDEAAVAHDRAPDEDKKDEPAKPETPEDRAKAAWAKDHAEQVAHRANYENVLELAQTALRVARTDVVTATTAKAGKDALARANRIERVAREAKSEIETVDTLYKAWRATTITARTETVSYELAIADLGTWTDDSPPVPGVLQGVLKDIWDRLGVIVRVQPLTAPAAAVPARPAVLPNPPLEGDRGGPDDDETIRWRIPRPVRVWVWRRTKTDGVALERVSSMLVVDKDSEEVFLPIDEPPFGEASATLEFGDLGAPSKLAVGTKSAIGAFVDALKGSPELIAAGLESAKKAEASFAGLRDAQEQHRLDAIKRRKDLLQARIDIKGLEATADDIATLKRLEQQVEIAEAEGSLGEPSELDLLKRDYELAKTRAALQRVLNGEVVEDEEPTIEDVLEDLVSRVAAIEDAAKGG